MFYPARMDHVVIGIHNRWLMDVTSALHSEGNLEVLELKKAAGDDLPQTHLDISREDIERIIALQFRTDRILEIIEPYEYKPESLKSILFPDDQKRVSVRYDSPDELYRVAEDFIRDAEPVLATYESLKKNRELIQVTRERIEHLSRLAILDIDLSYLAPAPYTQTIAGWMQVENLSTFEEWVRNAGTDEIFFYTKQAGEEVIVVCIGTRATQPLLEELVHHSWFFRMTLPETYAGLPGQLIASEQEALMKYQADEERCMALLMSMAGRHLTPLRAIREELGIVRDRVEVSRNFGSSRNVVYLHGWVRHKDTSHLHDLLKNSTNDEFFLYSRPATPDDDVPVRYDNPRWLAPFEILTTTFSRPRYDEIDPTPFFAPAYLLFFGLMLGDAGYGILITLVGWLLYVGPGRNDAPFRDMSYILIWCGIADIILGTLQGGWFGDLLPRFFHITPPFVMIQPLNQPILLFQIALIIGTIHINLGILLGLWQNIRARLYRTAVMDHGIWFILQPSAAVLLTEFFGWVTFAPPVTSLAVIGGVIGLVVLFVRNGPMGFFSLTGFLGDWLSYVRILALALATGGIAMTINILSEMIASVHPLMIIPAILFCIAGQLFNLAIQTLGSVIHALRLHYIEFFGKFYSGGGKEFVPFYERRIYTSGSGEDIV